MNSTVWPIFNEKIIKSRVYGFINSIFVHCLQKNRSAAEKKEKKKKN